MVSGGGEHKARKLCEVIVSTVLVRRGSKGDFPIVTSASVTASLDWESQAGIPPRVVESPIESGRWCRLRLPGIGRGGLELRQE